MGFGQVQTDDSALRLYTYFSDNVYRYGRLVVSTECGARIRGNTRAVQARITLAVSTALARTLSPGFARMARKGVVIRPEPATDSAHRSRRMESCDITSRMVAAVPLVAAQVITAAFSASLDPVAATHLVAGTQIRCQEVGELTTLEAIVSLLAQLQARVATEGGLR
jgi:hypothetical protein